MDSSMKLKAIPMDRRLFLGLAGTSAAIGASLLLDSRSVAAWTVPPSAVTDSAANATFAMLRIRWRDLNLGVGFDPTAAPFQAKLLSLGTQALSFMNTMAPARGSLWPTLSYLDPEPDGDAESIAFTAKITSSFQRLWTMAEAWAQPGTGHTGSQTLLDAVIAGLDHLTSDAYSPAHPRFGNWWDFQIGAARALGDTATLVFEHLSSARRAHYAACIDFYLPDPVVSSYTGLSTGANRVDLCRAIAISALLSENSARLSLASAALSPVFDHVTTGDGYYADGSFIQHDTVPYIGSYGAVLSDGVGRLLALLHGTEWEIAPPNLPKFFDAVDKAVAPLLYNGFMMDSVSGRSIARPATSGFVRAHSHLASIALIAKGVESATAERWRSMVKGWLLRNAVEPAMGYSAATTVRLAYLDELLRGTDVPPAPERAESRVFAQMDRVAHKRVDWAAALSMASARTCYYEYGNGENLRGWNTSNGWIQWLTPNTMDQYTGNFWPTVDPYHHTGTTTSLKPLNDGEGVAWGRTAPDTPWVGGAGDGSLSIAGQYLKAISSTLEARKSWIFLDDRVICLGAGITASDAAAIHTTIENRRVRASSDNTLTLDGVTSVPRPGDSATVTATWAHLSDHGGYVFPSGETVHASRQTRSGRWRDINSSTSNTQTVSETYVTMTIDHGVNPGDQGYSYVMLPGASSEQTRRAAACIHGTVQILSNTASVQAVHLPRLKTTAANFWQSATVKDLSSSGPASVLIRVSGTEATICVSDPTRTTGRLVLTWERAVNAVLEQPDTLSAVTTGERLRMEFEGLAGTQGATQVVRVSI
ncbi:polysaccharide lyase 8 family protein [Microbacterium esteraromaticum]|nr:polysaccharide lyase 8 family protein [Microbacterium esteraromaticum]